MANTLLVIINDRLSEIVQKGEVIDRYYNPGNVFDEVHILMANDDHPSPDTVQKMVGDAELYLHNYPAGKSLFLKSLGWRPCLLRRWAEGAVELTKKIEPDLVRCHGAHLNAYLGYRINLQFNIPYLVSMHLNQEEDRRRKPRGFKDWLISHSQLSMERLVLRNADLVLPVYQPIVPYLENLGVEHYEVCYNMINPKNLSQKENYDLDDTVKLISVGRQFKYKNPDNIIRALESIPSAALTLVGDGPYHDYLVEIAEESGVRDQVVFETSIPNDELCARLPDYDLYVLHSEYWELSKAMLEPLLTGLPLVVNERSGRPVPELEAEICRKVDNTPEAYRRVINKLIEDDDARESLGRRARQHSRERWAPEKTEQKYKRVYDLFLRFPPAEARDKLVDK